MHYSEENDEGVFRYTVPRRGSYPSYKFIFTKIARDVRPASLVSILEGLTGEKEEVRDLEDFDLIAMIAWFKSCHVYDIYKDWRDKDDSLAEMLYRIDQVIGDHSWSPSIGTLAGGGIF